MFSNETPGIANVHKGRKGEAFTSTEILAAAVVAGSARIRPDGCVQWNQDAGRSIHHEYLAAMRREERAFDALLAVALAVQAPSEALAATPDITEVDDAAAFIAADGQPTVRLYVS